MGRKKQQVTPQMATETEADFNKSPTILAQTKQP